MKTNILPTLTTAMASIMATLSANAATLTWDAGGGGGAITNGGGAWLTTGLWNNGGVAADWTSGDDAIFGGPATNGGAVTLASPTTVNSLTFNIFTGTYTLGTAGQTMTLNNGLTMNSGAGAVTLISPVTLGAAQSWLNNTLNNLTVGTGAVDNGGFLLTIGGSGNTTVSSVIGGAGGLTKTGAGQLTLSGVNSFAGPLSIENGRVFANSLNNKAVNGVLGAGTTVVLGSSGQTGRLAIQLDGAVSSNKDFTLAAGGTGELQFGNIGTFQITNADRSMTLSGNFGGSGNLVKLGGAAVVLSGNNTYNGTTTVNEGPLRLGSASAIPGGIGATGGTSALTINGNGSLNVGAVVQLTAASGDFLRGLGAGADQFQIPGGVSGFDANGSARQVIVGNNAAFELQWGIPAFNPSALLLGYHSSVSTGALTLQNKIDLNAANRTIQVNGGSATISGDIRTTSGTAGITKAGAGTLVLSGNNTYTGPTTISGGTLTLNNTSTFDNTSQIVLGGSGTLNVNAANASLARLVTGGGVPVGTFLRYSQAQTAAGAANGPGTIRGTVELNVTNVNPDYTLDFGAGSTLQNAVAATYASPVTLSGNASINSSTAVFTGGTALTIGSSTAGAKTLTLTGTNTGANTLGGVIGNGSGTVAVTKSNTGAWTLTGANTYSGVTTISGGTLTLSGVNGSIGGSPVTVAGGTLTVSNTAAANHGDRLSGSEAFSMKGGTFNYNNDASNNAFSETAGSLTLLGGLNTVAIQQAGASGTSTLTFAGLSRTAGVVNFSGAGLGAAVNPRSQITFSGVPALSNGIIGPWATVNGTTYATLIGNDLVAYSGAMTDVTRQSSGTKVIPDSATAHVRIIEGSGGSPAGLTLANIGGTTTIDTLLQSISGGTAAATVIIGAAETLRANAINSVATAGALTLGAAANTGTLTPATSGGNLLLINSGGTMTVNSVLADNTSSSSLTKDGSGVLKLAGTNTYGGGTTINAGTVWVTTDAHLGAAGSGITFNASAALSFGQNTVSGVGATLDLGSRPITLNNGAIAGLHNNEANKTITVSGNITGDGGIIFGRDPVLTYGGGSGFLNLNLLGSGNTFTGPVTLGVNASENIGTGGAITINSLGNSTSPITFNLGGGGWSFGLGAGATGDLLLPDRPIDLLNSNATMRNQSATNIMLLGPVSTSTSGAKTLNLGNGAAGATIAGAISNGIGTIAVTKSGTGTWALSGVNTYTGLTTINDGGGTLAFRNADNSLPAATSITIGGSAGLSLLDDSAGTINLGNNVNLNVVGTGERDGPTIFVGNNGGATTGSTIALGVVDLVAGGSDPRSTQIIHVTGANGYRLQLSGLIIGKRADFGAPQINPTTASVTITGTVTQASGKLATDSTAGDRLELIGTSTGNLISGVIQNAADYPSNPNAKPFNLLKGGTSTWALSNNNTYTGVTTVSGGVLRLDHANALPGGIGTTGGTSALTFNGGVIGLGVGDFNRNLAPAGTATGVNFTGAGGWAAYGADRAVNLNNDSHAIIWADANTGLNGQTLILGAADATHTVDFQHPLDLGAATRTVQVDNGAAAVDAKLSELLSGTGGGLTKNGAGTLLLLAANTYTGSTIINQGTLRVVGSASLGGATGSSADANNIVFGQNLNSGVLEFETAANLGPAGQIRFRNTGGTAGQGGALKYVGTTHETVSKTIQCDTSIGIRLESDSVGGSITFNGAFSQTNRGIYLGGTGTGDNRLDTAFTGNGTLTKRDSGTWILGADNTYTGTTRVTGGTLLVEGSTAATGLVIVSSGATIGGSGSVGDVTVLDGDLSPGGALGNTFLVNNLYVDPASGLRFGLADPLVPGDNDIVNINQTLTLGGQLFLTPQTGVPAYDFTTATPGTQWTLFTYSPGNLGISGDLVIVSAPALASGLGWSVDTTSSDSSVFLVVVPEAGTGALLGLGAMVLLLRRRFSR